MAETEEERKARMLEELKGKNVAYYSVMLTAYISARVDANKAIFAFSSTGIGFLVAIASKLQQLSACAKAVYVGALLAFFAAACSTLFVYVKNAKAIESYIRSEGNEKAKDFELKTWKYVNYVSFSVGLALLLVLAVLEVLLR